MRWAHVHYDAYDGPHVHSCLVPCTCVSFSNAMLTCSRLPIINPGCWLGVDCLVAKDLMELLDTPEMRSAQIHRSALGMFPPKDWGKLIVRRALINTLLAVTARVAIFTASSINAIGCAAPSRLAYTASSIIHCLVYQWHRLCCTVSSNIHRLVYQYIMQSKSLGAVAPAGLTKVQTMACGSAVSA